jgi:hypothetical protein
MSARPLPDRPLSPRYEAREVVERADLPRMVMEQLGV